MYVLFVFTFSFDLQNIATLLALCRRLAGELYKCVICCFMLTSDTSARDGNWSEFLIELSKMTFSP